MQLSAEPVDHDVIDNVQTEPDTAIIAARGEEWIECASRSDVSAAKEADGYQAERNQQQGGRLRQDDPGDYCNASRKRKPRYERGVHGGSRECVLADRAVVVVCDK